MVKLEELAKGVVVEGIEPDGPVTVVNVEQIGEDSVELFYKDSSGNPGGTYLYRFNEPMMRLVGGGEEWSFDGSGKFFRLAAEAKRIQMAYLFDPLRGTHVTRGPLSAPDLSGLRENAQAAAAAISSGR
jgi:hypothetical protein